MGRFVDITGQVFGRWTVINLALRGKNPRFFCKCECGTERVVLGFALRRGGSKSCGCIWKIPTEEERQERQRKANRETARKSRLKIREPLKYARLLEALNYSPESGIWTWRIATARHQNEIGSLAGRINKTHGRLEIGLDGKRYSASRLAWLYMTGEWPEVEVDHWDTNCLNNKWDNLRLATRGQNESNKGITKRNTSGFKGVSWSREKNKWLAQIACGGKHKFIGYFDDPKEAHAAYSRELIAFYGEFARVG